MGRFRHSSILAQIFLSRLEAVPGLTRIPHSASMMSSTRRTDTPARYISTGASSTEFSRRRQRSMMAASKLWRRSFGIFGFTSPDFMCSARPWRPARVPRRPSLRPWRPAPHDRSASAPSIAFSASQTVPRTISPG